MIYPQYNAQYMQPLQTLPHPMPSPSPTPTPSRKRRAPGTIPISSIPNPYFTPPNSSDQLPSWNPGNSNFMDNSAANVNPYMMSPPQQSQFPQQGIPIATPSTALARRGMNNQLVHTPRAFNPQPTEVWPNFAEDSLVPQSNGGGAVDEHDNIELLEEKAQKAKREAQAKRKQIPPFVQKLNSFLEESKNTDLIRWSDKGDSFIVLDEDEFAKTLIPELFKHNNYASFVRQLNMYGFHKKVGLSDNSMKASERKNKSPSEYYNPYFRRGHPNLLWLINKPKSGAGKKNSKGKRPDEADVESEEDNVEEPTVGPTTYTAHNVAATNRALPAPDQGSMTRKDLTIVRDQMSQLQEQQRTIHDAIGRLRREHVQLVNQARQFQEQHNRHENAINSILSFLANVFRGKIDEGGMHNISELFNGIMSNGPIPQPQQSGTVVDLGDWEQQQQGMPASMESPLARHQRLLMPVPGDVGVKRSASASTTPTPFSPAGGPQLGTITELFDSPGDTASVATPSHMIQDMDTPQESMMKLMQNINTTANNNNNNSSVTMPDIGGRSPAITNDQRNRMLSIISGGHGNPGSSPVAPTFSSAPPQTTPVAPVPTSQASLSPLMGSPVAPPSLQQLAHTQEELGHLQRLQEEQSAKLDELSSLLGPYSPSGKIPGLGDAGAQGYFDDNIDFGQYLDSNAFNADGLPSDFDFNANLEPLNTDNLFGDPSTDGGARIVETSTPSNKSSSPGGTEEIPRTDLDASPGRAAKRQRKG